MATTPVVSGRLEAGSEIKVPDGEGGEQIVKIAGRFDVYTAENGYDVEAIASAVADGSILADENTVVKVDKEYVVYTQLLAVTLTAATLLSQGQTDLPVEDGKPSNTGIGVCRKYNYGNDLDAKRQVRQLHEKTKPASLDKTIAKTVAGLVALGYPEDEAKIMATARQPQA